MGAYQGWSVSLSADGNTAIVGGRYDNYTAGAAWIWTRSAGVWTQQGTKLVGSGAESAQQGFSVSLSADGNTAIVGGDYDNGQGAAWVYSVTAVLTVPGAPTILSITPGPEQVIIILLPPSNTGGGPIVSYSAICTASGHPDVTATSTTTTIIVPGLVPGVSYACTATASNGSYVSLATPATSAIPKPKVDLSPILMLLLD